MFIFVNKKNTYFLTKQPLVQRTASAAACSPKDNKRKKVSSK